MKKRSLHTVEDNQFGRGAPYAFPGDIQEAGKFLTLCTFIESSSECLEREFYEEEDTEDVRECFKNATEWPRPYLVASAAYHFLAWTSKIDAFDWKKLFYVLLTVGEPLFEMIHRNKWADPNRESIRKGFKMELESVIELDDRKCPYSKIQWFHEGGASWFQFGTQKGRVSPENLLGSLKLVGTNETVARLAVREVFETETLYPFYTALLHHHL